jgi:hypothetical protein
MMNQLILFSKPNKKLKSEMDGLLYSTNQTPPWFSKRITQATRFTDKLNPNNLSKLGQPTEKHKLSRINITSR